MPNGPQVPPSGAARPRPPPHERPAGDGGPQRGQGIVEYALVIFLVAITVIAIFVALGDQVAAIVSTVYDAIRGILPPGPA